MDELHPEDYRVHRSGSVHCVGCATLLSILGHSPHAPFPRFAKALMKPFYDRQMAILSSSIHCVGCATLLSIIMKPLHGLQTMISKMAYYQS